MIYINRHLTEKGEILAMCDEELIGRILSEGRMEIDLKRYASFYQGELVNEEQAKKMINENIISANAVGDRSVGILVEKRILKSEQVRKIQGVSFVQIYSIEK